MSSATRCSACSASLTPSSFAEHQRRYHRPQSAKACSHCPYSSRSLSDAIAHCFLEGHRLDKGKQKTLFMLPLEVTAVGVGASIGAPQVALDIYSEELLCNTESQKGKQVLHNWEEPQGIIAGIGDMHDTLTLKQNQPAVSLICAKCRATVKASRWKHRKGVAMSHVMSCNFIRPYACSSCGHLSSQKENAKVHVKRMCPDGTVEKVDKDENDAAIVAGLRQCFPNETFKFDGL